MAPKKKNPLNLNALQLKTLTLLQYMATLDGHGKPCENPEDGVRISNLPHAHGNHFHLGDVVVSTANATGLSNEAVYIALTRKGLVSMSPSEGITITAAGLAYETHLADDILHRSDH